MTSFIRPFTEQEFGKKGNIVGTGSYGEVFVTDKNVAVKVTIQATDIIAIREAAMMNYLQHPNIIKPIAIDLSTPSRMVLPLAAGSLYTLKHLDTDIRLRKWCFYQVLRAVAYCHSKFVWHLDLKLDNVLYQTVNATTYMTQPWPYQYIIKLADFGLSLPFAFPSPDNFRPNMNRNLYSPELLAGDPKYDASVDMWTFGVMLLDAINKNNLQLFANPHRYGPLANIATIIGSPDSEARAYLKTLPEWPKNQDGVALDVFLNLQKMMKLSSLVTDTQEFDLLRQILTYRADRISAVDALDHYYFTEIRDIIASDMPFTLQFDNCGDLLLRELDPDSTIIYDGPEAYEYIRKQLTLKMSFKTVLYACALYKVYVQEHDRQFMLIVNQAKFNSRDTINAIIYIAIAMYQPFKMRMDHVVAELKTSELVIQQNVITILTVLDFNICIPSCFEFAEVYVYDHISPSLFRRICQTMLLMLMNKKSYDERNSILFSDLAANYIARIACEYILGDNFPRDSCINRRPKILTAGMRKILD